MFPKVLIAPIVKKFEAFLGAWAPRPLGRSSEGLESIAGRSERLFRATKSTQERSNWHFQATWSPEIARRGLWRAILVDLGSILGATGIDFFGLSLLFRSSGPIR